jgi:hypothetical protein
MFVFIVIIQFFFLLNIKDSSLIFLTNEESYLKMKYFSKIKWKIKNLIQVYFLNYLNSEQVQF